MVKGIDINLPVPRIDKCDGYIHVYLRPDLWPLLYFVFIFRLFGDQYLFYSP